MLQIPPVVSATVNGTYCSQPLVEITKTHKEDVAKAIENILPEVSNRKQIAMSLALAIDGAIIRAQFDDTPDTALSLLAHIAESEVSAQQLH